MERLIAGAARLGLELDSRQVEQFRVFYRELVDWNQRLNLTAIIGYEEAQVRHFLDSLTVTQAWDRPSGESQRVIDVGTGAGMPGIPLKIVWPGIKLVLLDSTAKKAVFLQHVVAVLGLGDVEVVVGRAEEIAHREQYRERFDVALSRGVAPLPALVELTLPFCAIGGRLVAQKKGAVALEVAQSGRAIATLGGRLRESKRVALDELSDDRYLVIVDKVSATPGAYPRRPGMPAKRPLIDKPGKR